MHETMLILILAGCLMLDINTAIRGSGKIVRTTAIIAAGAIIASLIVKFGYVM